MPEKIYLDDKGNPIVAESGSAKVYLDDNGNPIGAKSSATTPARDGRAVLGDAVMNFGKGVLRTVRDHPVESAATAGAMAAVPLTGGASLLPAMAAAGLGGAGGAGLGLMVKGARGDADTPNTAGGVLGTMGEQGAVQAAMEGGGRMISGMLRSGASRLYQGLLKPTQAARLDNPNLVQTALANRIPVSAGGAEKAGDLVGESMGKADALVAAKAAEPNAPMIDPRRAIGGIANAVRDVKDLPVARPQMRAIGDYGRQYLAEHPGPIAVTDAQRAVRATDKFFNPAYRATMDRGNAITSGSTAAALGINNETRGLLRQAVPGLQEQNAVTSGLVGVRDAVERRAGQQGNLSPVGMQHLINAGIGGGVGAVGGKDKGLSTFAAMEALTNPAIGSRLAIGGHMAAGLPWAQAVRAAVMARLAGDDQPTGGK